MVIQKDFFDSDIDDIQHDIIGNRENGNTFVTPFIPCRVIYVTINNNEFQISLTNVDGGDDVDSKSRITSELNKIVEHINAASKICQDKTMYIWKKFLFCI